jgi:hypothetical protein
MLDQVVVHLGAIELLPQVYRRRRDRLVTLLARRAPAARVGAEGAGLHLLVHLPDGATEADTADAKTRELALDGLASYRIGAQCHPPALVVGYGTPPEHTYSTASALSSPADSPTSRASLFRAHAWPCCPAYSSPIRWPAPVDLVQSRQVLERPQRPPRARHGSRASLHRRDGVPHSSGA